MQIDLPNRWAPAAHQLPLWKHMMGGGDRAAAVWHRRAGKDSSSINFTAVAAHQRVGAYWHMLPTANQARKVVWNAIDRHGRRVIDQAFPREIRTRTNDTDMLIELACGSIWQCVGSDNYNNLVGANPVGIVFSEYAVADPAAWDFLRPILRENKGWAIFIFTFRGRNHGYKLYKSAEHNPKWFSEILTVEDTLREDGLPIITPEDVQEEIEAGMDEAIAMQEFYCSPDAGMVGSIYGKALEEAKKNDRIRTVPYEPDLPVHTAWDLGWDDSTAIWFYQTPTSREVRFIDYYESREQPLGHYIKYAKEQEYIYGQHWAPHDIQVHEYTLGASRWERALQLGFRFDVAPKQSLQDGIDKSRALIRKAYFDKERCARGLECLENYQYKRDERTKSYGRQPVHNWASNGSDAFRTAAVTLGGVTTGKGYDMTSWDDPLPLPRTGVI